MADKYAQGGVTTAGTPTPTTIRAGEYAIHWNLEITDEGRRYITDAITGRNTATFPPCILHNDEDTEG